MALASAPVYVIVDPGVVGYTPVLAAYPSRDEARPHLLALVTMSQDGVVQIREYVGRERKGTWDVRRRDGGVEVLVHRGRA